MRASARIVRGLVAALATAVACGSSGGVTGPPPGKGLAVLFVGNSLTYTNDLPDIVAAISLGASDDPPFRVGTVAFPGVSLEDHWAIGDALEAIDTGEWDVVVLQQGPSTTDANRAHLVEWSERFAERIRAAGARPALLMVWPVDGSTAGFAATRASYTAAAEAVGGTLIAASEAWLATRARDPRVSLTQIDGFHPSLLGSVIAAYAAWHALGGRSPVGLPPVIEGPGVPRITLTAELAATVQAAVVEAQAAHGRP
jgi:hypothetical protein